LEYAPALERVAITLVELLELLEVVEVAALAVVVVGSSDACGRVV